MLFFSNVERGVLLTGSSSIVALRGVPRHTLFLLLWRRVFGTGVPNLGEGESLLEEELRSRSAPVDTRLGVSGEESVEDPLRVRLRDISGANLRFS